MLALRAARRAQISIRVVLNSYAASAPVSSERQSACGAACGMLNALLPQRHHISTAAQPADAAISGRQPILTWLAHRQPAALLLGVRGYAKGSAKSKHDKNKQAAPERTRQESHGRHATATPEGSLVDFAEEKQQMEAALNYLKQELGSMRTGRASPGMLDHIKVEAYGEKMNLNTLATVLARDSQLLVASVFDPTTLPAVEKAIAASPLGLNPRIDGQEVLIPVPRPSAKTQDALAKLCKQEVEAAKVSVRNARHSGLAAIKTVTSEDERFRAERELQQLTDKYVQLVEQLGAEKAKDISHV